MATKTARRTEQDLLGVYLNDHLAGATVGVGLVRRMAASAEPGSETAAVVKPLVSEITADRSALVTMISISPVTIFGFVFPSSRPRTVPVIATTSSFRSARPTSCAWA